MSGDTGFHTSLGGKLNQIEGTIDTYKGSRIAFRYGIITDVYAIEGTNVYRYDVRFPDEHGRLTKSRATNITIADTFDNLALRSGDPKTLLNKSCIVVFTGPSSNRGFIIALIDNTNTEKVEKSNELSMRGASFCPPGSKFG